MTHRSPCCFKSATADYFRSRMNLGKNSSETIAAGGVDAEQGKEQNGESPK